MVRTVAREDDQSKDFNVQPKISLPVNNSRNQSEVEICWVWLSGGNRKVMEDI